MHSALDKPTLDNRSRFRLYEYTVSFFLRHGEYVKAAMFFSRMSREGYVPSITIRTLMRVAEVAGQQASEEELMATIETAFTNEAFGEDALRELLQVLSEGLSASPAFIDRVAFAFITLRQPDAPLSMHTVSCIVRAHVRTGDSKGATAWVENPSRLPVPTSRKSKTLLYPYTTILRDLGRIKPEWSVYKWALEEMQAQDPNMVPDLAFFNALLAHEISRNNFDVVFAVFERMFAQRAPPYVPDAHTFSTMFRALHRLSVRETLPARLARGHRAPDNMPSARSVFRSMLLCDAERRPFAGALSSVADARTLQKALRVFLGAWDYAAAHVVLRHYRALPPGGRTTVEDTRTCTLVVNALVGRTRLELPRAQLAPAPARFWAHRFLGLADLHTSAPALPFDLSMLYRVFTMGTERTAHLRWTDVPTEEDERGREALDAKIRAVGLPTPREFLGMDTPPPGKMLSLEGLQRIVERALLASCGEVVLPAGYVASQVRQAREEMEPPADTVKV